MTLRNDPKYAGYFPSGNWVGRSLENYLSQNPKAVGAKTLTDARKLAFGEKSKSTFCKCGQPKCQRSSGKGGSHC